MKIAMLAISALSIGLSALGQKVYVSCDDHKPKGSIEKKISELNYIVVDDSTKADVIAKFVYKKLKNPYVSFKVKPNIAAKIIFYGKGDMLLSMTDDAGGISGVWAGYNPRIDAAWKILTRDFEVKLKEAIDKYNNRSSNTSISSGIQPISKTDQLTKLKKLYDEGILTKEEFEAEKQKILASPAGL